MGVFRRIAARVTQALPAAVVACGVALTAGGVPALAMQLPEPGEIERLKESGEYEARKKFADEVGNNKVDPELLKKAVNKAKRKALQQQGFATSDVDQMAGTYAPPPAWSGMPTTGNVKIFALLIDFPDYTAVTTQANVNDMLFGAGNPADAPYESLAAYYSRSSYGQLDFSAGTTLGWYRPAYNRSSVSQTSTGRENLIKEALNYFDAQGHDFSQYDNNGDGKIDYFLVIWTGTPGAWASFWWGYQTSFVDSTYFLDGKRLGKYSWQWESSPYGQQFTPLVTIHETGHALGLPDYYDYSTGVGPKGGVGGLDMMDHNWGDHNAFNKWVLDWITPTVVANGSQTITLNPSATSPEAVLIMPGITTGDLFDEYFMVQNRYRTGNDSGIPNDGLLIWHVDATLNAGGTNYIYDNSGTTRKLLRLMEADGLEEIEKDLSYNDADAGDFYVPGKSFGPGTAPSSKSYAGYNSGVSVSNIVSSGNQVTATFSVNGAAPSGSVKINGTAAACNSTTVTLTLTATGGSAPVSQMRFSNDNAVWSAWQPYATSTSWTLSAGDGEKTVYVQFRNLISLDSDVNSDTITLDTVAPQAVILANGSLDGVSKATTFGFSVNGVAGYKYKIDAGAWSAEIPGTTTMNITGVTTGTHTLSVIGKDAAGNWQSTSAPTSLSWTVDVTAPTTTASPAGGTYTGAQSVTLSANETATIYYTTNGSAPTTASTVYTAPITMTPPATLKYFAVDALGNKELVKTQLYALPAGVKLNGVPAAMTKLTSATVTVSGTYVTYKYIFDGGAESAEIPIATKIAKTGLAAGAHTLSVRGKTSAGVWQSSPTTAGWTVDTTLPVTTASPAGGTYADAQTVTLSASETATIYYTKTGAAPSTSSPKYTGAIPITATTTLKYFAVDPAGNAEAVKTQVYNLPPVVTLAGVPASLSKLTSVLVTVGGAGVSAYQYSLDGGSWSAETPVATKISLSGLSSAAHTISVKGKHSVTGTWQATPTTAGWTVDATKPVTTASPAGGTYAGPQTVTLSASETATIYYTTTGATPAASSPKYTGPISVNATTTLKFYAVDPAGNAETVQTHLYTLPLTAVITGTPAPLTKITSATLTVGGAGVTAYKYSIDGGAVSAEIPISTKISKTGLTAGSHTVSVYGKNAAGTWQATPTTVSWTIDLTKPVTTASLAAGTYGSPQTVTLSANETATIYYTITGAAPSTASPKYTGPIAVNTTTTLKYLAVDTAGNAEVAKSAVYALPPTAQITGAPTGTTAATTASFTVSGSYVTAYKYKLDSGSWSAEISVAQTRSLVGLESGTHSLSVIGKNAAGTWQDSAAATTAVWTVQ